jgi:fructokinase
LTSSRDPEKDAAMTTPDVTTLVAQIVDRIKSLSGTGRRMIALAGPPAAGKSTVAKELVTKLGEAATLVPMDGFHYSNDILDAKGLRARKGAPETFDLAGFKSLLSRLKAEPTVAVPTFDRTLDCSIGSSRLVEAAQQIIVVEGNYLLLDERGWRDLATFWDMSVFLEVPVDTLKKRLIERWLTHGFNQEDAEKKANSNDIPNAMRVVENHLDADLIL